MASISATVYVLSAAGGVTGAGTRGSGMTASCETGDTGGVDGIGEDGISAPVFVSEAAGRAVIMTGSGVG
jgi:hypothetical protein